MKIESGNTPFVPNGKQVESINKSVPSAETNPHQEKQQLQTSGEENKDKNQLLNEEQLQAKLDKINHTVALYNKQLKFEFHKDANQLMVKVINKETHEVIRELPPEEILDLEARIRNMIGILIDEKL
ncbi:MAG: flagellar protein FlaG [Bacillaceae bacterium]|nr:flagellar protein FlaG [Bacillaceae bacterium]